jgi:hypothetical protein
MISKIETMRDLLVDMTHNQHKKVAAFMPYIADLLRAAPVVESLVGRTGGGMVWHECAVCHTKGSYHPDVKWCICGRPFNTDPVVERQPAGFRFDWDYEHGNGWCRNATRFVETLEEVDHEDKSTWRNITALYTAPPELAELQATIAQLETKLNNAINLDFERRAEIERLTADLKIRDRELEIAAEYHSDLQVENERLKGGQGEAVALSVWYGPMPESNGKSNWTAILHRKGYPIWEGSCITLDRSEYPDRVRYEADRARYLIGELEHDPDITSYDEDKHSGYVRPSHANAPADSGTHPHNDGLDDYRVKV